MDMGQGATLRGLLGKGRIVIAPGVFDGLTARLAELQGFPVVYATGAGISNSQYALADMGLVSYKEVLEQVAKITGAVAVPVVADADTGYGNPVNVVRTVREFIRAGVAAIQLEDQVAPKRCGHFAGKEIVSRHEGVLKIRAAVEARGDNDLLIVARTDAIAVDGLSEALWRAQAYHAEGADIIFVEAPRNRDELARIGREVPGLKLANMVEGGVTPLIPARQLEDMGFHMAIYANCVLRSAIKAVQATLSHLWEQGDTTAILDQLVTMDERNRVTGKAWLDDLTARYVTVGEAPETR